MVARRSTSRHGKVGARRTLAVLMAVASIAWGAGTGGAADPSSGTVGPREPQIDWTGEIAPASRAFFGPDHCPPERDPNGTLCDHFWLTVDVAADHWDSFEGGVEVTIEFDYPPAEDMSLHVYRDGKMIVSSVTRGLTGMEQVLIPRAVGEYEIRVTPEIILNHGFAPERGYRGTARFISGPSRAPTWPNQSYRGVRIVGPNPKTEPQTLPVLSVDEQLVLQAVDVGRNAGEPTIGVDASGNAFFLAMSHDGTVTPQPRSARSMLMRSTDGGLSWETATPRLPVSDDPGHFGTFDPYLHVDDSSGRIFMLDLLVAGTQLSVSDDGGDTYRTEVLSTLSGVQDRPWLVTGPVPAGTSLTTTDPAFREIVYYCSDQWTHQSCARSLDGGLSFTPTGTFPALKVDSETQSECGLFAGDGQTDGDGRLFVPYMFCDRSRTPADIVDHWLNDAQNNTDDLPMLAMSDDAGATWERVLVSDQVRGKLDNPQVSSDTAGNLYYVWTDDVHRLPYIAISTNHGRTWSEPLMVAPPGVRETSFVNIVAGDDGRLAVLFVGTTVADETDLTRPWNVYLAITTEALAERPLFVSSTANDPADPIHRGNCPLKCAGMLDFLDIQRSPFDGSVWATAVDTCTNIARCRSDALPGYKDHTSDGVARDSRGIAIRQLAGPWLTER